MNVSTKQKKKIHNIIVITEIIAFKLFKQLIINTFSHIMVSNELITQIQKVQVNAF